MTPTHLRRRWRPTVAALIVGLAALGSVRTPGQQDDPRVHFRTSIDLVNVTVTVTDRQGRFVRNLTPNDFVIYEDGRPQPLTYFASERAPVSLGIAIDTSGSMAGEKIAAAREALRRFLEDLLGADDEIFVYRFSDSPVLLQEWTADRTVLRSRLNALRPSGGTALYDTVAEALPIAQSGQHRKKALVVISDGMDTNSTTTVQELRQQIRATDLLVYAVGIDGTREPGFGVWRQSQMAQRRQPPRPPIRWPLPIPGGGRDSPLPFPPGPTWPAPLPPTSGSSADDGVDEVALREMTDDSGGRTEIVRFAREIDAATAGIADELSRQYLLVYAAAAKKDGRWHTIRVEVGNRGYHVRARRGYTAS